MKILNCSHTFPGLSFKSQRFVFWMSGGGSAESDARDFIRDELPRRRRELERLEREEPDSERTRLYRLLVGTSARAASQICGEGIDD